MQHDIGLFCKDVLDIAAMLIVEAIFHHEAESNFAAEENDGDESEYHSDKAEHFEDVLEEAGYSYVGINSIIYLYKGDDLIANLDTDEYSWHNISDETIDPFTQVNALIDAIANGLPK